MRPVCQIEQSDETEQYGGTAYQNEDPAPTAPRMPMDIVQNPARNGNAAGNGHRLRQHEIPLRFGAVLAAKPVGKKHDHAREKTRLRDAEQQPQRVELRLGAEG